MNVSVIIPTYNGEPTIANVLTLVNNQDADISEILVIDSSSYDKTVEIVRSFNIEPHIIPQSEFDHGGTRTKAAKMAKGEFLVFLSQDAIPATKNAIKNLIRIFDNPDVAAGYGRQLPHQTSKPFGEHLRLFNYPDKSIIKSYKDKEHLGIKTTFLSDSFSAYRKEKLEEIGWFKENLIFGEDSVATAMLLKKGYKIAYAADAQVYHSHDYSITEDFRRYFDIGVFHTSQSWLLKEFGKAEKEGNEYVKSEFKHLVLKKHRYDLIPLFFIRILCKYFGYKLGQRYGSIPLSITSILSMSPNWWKKINSFHLIV